MFELRCLDSVNKVDRTANTSNLQLNAEERKF